MKRKSYKTVRQFNDDIEWFRHNCRSVFPKNRRLQEASNELIAFVIAQIDDILTCTECCTNVPKYGARSFAVPCSTPHLLVWAQNGNFVDYRPAKVLAVNLLQSKVHVRFFGDHSWSDLPANRTYLYSKNCPEYSGCDPESYNKAIKVSVCNHFILHFIWMKENSNFSNFSSFSLKEADEYIENIRTKFGNYNFAKQRIVFEPKKLKTYVEDMTAKDQNKIPDEIINESSASNNQPPTIHSQLTVDMVKANQNPARKRNATSSSSNDKLAKTKCLENDANKTDEADLVDTIENNLKCCIDREMLRMKESYGNLKKDLQKTTIEKQTLEQQSAALIGEKNALEQKIALLDQERMTQQQKNVELAKQYDDEKKTITEGYRTVLQNAKIAFEAEKKTLMEENAALKMEISKEKKNHDDKKRALEESIREMMEIMKQ